MKKIKLTDKEYAELKDEIHYIYASLSSLQEYEQTIDDWDTVWATLLAIYKKLKLKSWLPDD